MKSIILTVALVLTMLTVGLLTASTAEAVNCGDTLGAGGSFTLTADLGPCANNTVLTVQGPTVVDLGGHTVSCDGGPGTGQVGIQIIGKGAVLRNGRVIDCGWGIVALGGGNHQIRNILSEHNGAAFYVGSAHNVLTNNGAVSVDPGFSNGFFIQGDSNILTDNLAKGWGEGAFFVAAGCTFTCGTASYNTLKGNTATDNVIGFFVAFSASDNILTSNQVFANGTAPFCCPERAGIFLDSSASRNYISSNVALGNGPSDLRDDSINCDRNIWTNNVFGTRNQPCIH